MAVRHWLLALGVLAPVGAGAQARATVPPKLVLEAGVGGGSQRAGCGGCRELAAASSGMVQGHLALGVIVRPPLSLYLSEDGGANLTFDGSSETYQFTTAFAELSTSAAPPFALRIGAGYGQATALSGSLRGAGALVRVGLAARTPARLPVGAVLAIDEIGAVSGRYSPHAEYLAGVRPPFRPLTFQLSLGLRAQIPLR